MYKVKWTRLQADIFRLLCIRTSQSLSLRGMARMLKVSPTAVSNALALLEKEGLIISRKATEINMLSIEFNRDSQKAIGMKRAENLRLLYESGLHQFLFDKFPGSTIVLFGSYSRGEDTWPASGTRSDIDIAIIGSKKKDIDLSNLEKILERTISLNFYESWNSIHRQLRNNILRGIVLKGDVDI